MPRPRDSLRVEAVGGGSIDNFTSIMVTNDITMPSECAIELGNDGTFSAIEDQIVPGTEYKVFLNNNLRLSGRVEMTDLSFDSPGGSVVRYTIRTKLADAMFASADPFVSTKDVTLKDFLLQLYDPLGYTESDFIFRANVARDLMTGQDTSGKGNPVSVFLEKIDQKSAKVSPPEAIYDAADRHLRRFGYMHWDSPDGKIVVGAPNDTQDPIYYLRANRGTAGVENNIIGATRTQDWSEVPSNIGFHGTKRGKGGSRQSFSTFEYDHDVANARLHRPITILADGITSQSLGETAAAREMSARRKRKDAFDIETDGLSWWNGQENIPWGVDCVCTIDSDVAGGQVGAYYVHRIVHRRDAGSGDTTNVGVVKKGLWRLVPPPLRVRKRRFEQQQARNLDFLADFILY